MVNHGFLKRAFATAARLRHFETPRGGSTLHPTGGLRSGTCDGPHSSLVLPESSLFHHPKFFATGSSTLGDV